MKSTFKSLPRRSNMKSPSPSVVRQTRSGMPTPPVSITDNSYDQPNKRQRISPPSSTSTPNSPARSNKSGEDNLTPPSSAKSSETMSLRLIIPREEVTKDDHRTLAIRRAAAERWKPKLQNPYPRSKEIGSAYKLKLLRHYASSQTSSEPNFVKPRIDVSPRVNKLIARFPKMNTSHTGRAPPAPGFAALEHPSPAQDLQRQQDFALLRANKAITRSDEAQKLAWKSFSNTEKDRIDRGREAMMESGLVMDDLFRENRGQENALPEWRKLHTGRFAN